MFRDKVTGTQLQPAISTYASVRDIELEAAGTTRGGGDTVFEPTAGITQPQPSTTTPIRSTSNPNLDDIKKKHSGHLIQRDCEATPQCQLHSLKRFHAYWNYVNSIERVYSSRTTSHSI